MRLAVAACLFFASTSAALATDATGIDKTKLYVSDPADCDGSVEDGNLTLRFDRGIEAYEYHCDFFEVKEAPGSSFLLIEAVCEEPGLRNPDLFSVSPWTDNQIEVVSLYESMMFEPSEDNPDPGVTIYTRCD